MSSRKAVLAAFIVSASITSISAKDDKKVIKQLKADIGYLASDSLQGRRTGSQGERLAGDYIIANYIKHSIKPYKTDYRYPFTFVNGKEIMPLTEIIINGNRVTDKEEAFPAPFTANSKRMSGDAIPGVFENGNIWIVPLYADKDEANDAHFDWEKFAYEKAKDAVKQGASGILFYDSYGAKYPTSFNKKSEYEPADIPVIILTNKGYKAYMEGKEGNVNVQAMGF